MGVVAWNGQTINFSRTNDSYYYAFRIIKNDTNVRETSITDLTAQESINLAGGNSGIAMSASPYSALVYPAISTNIQYTINSSPTSNTDNGVKPFIEYNGSRTFSSRMSIPPGMTISVGVTKGQTNANSPRAVYFEQINNSGSLGSIELTGGIQTIVTDSSAIWGRFNILGAGWAATGQNWNVIMDFYCYSAGSGDDLTISQNTTFLSGISYIYKNVTVNSGITLSIQTGAIVKVSNLLTNSGSIIHGTNGTGTAGGNGSRYDNDSSGGGGGGSAQSPLRGTLTYYTDQPDTTIYGGGTGGQGGNNGGGGGAGGGPFKIIARKIINNGVISSNGGGGGGGSVYYNCNSSGGGTGSTGGGGGGGGGAIFIFSEEISGTGSYSVAGGAGGSGAPRREETCMGHTDSASAGGGSAGAAGLLYFVVGLRFSTLIWSAVALNAYQYLSGGTYATLTGTATMLYLPASSGSIIWL